MTSPSSATSPLAVFVAKRVYDLQHRRSQKLIARTAGLRSRALECDERQLMRLALRQFHSEDLVAQIERSLQDGGATPSPGPASPLESAADPSRLIIEVVSAHIRTGLLRHDLAAANRTLRIARIRTERIEQGLKALAGELDEIGERARHVAGET